MKAGRSLALMAVGGALAYGGNALAHSGVFNLKSVELSGDRYGKLSVAGVAAVGRLSKGDNLLKLSTDDAARRIERIPWVADASVERVLPSRIRVKVVERRPAAVAVGGGRHFVVDRTGMVLEAADAELVHLTEMPLPALRPGDKVELRQFGHTQKILAALDPAVRQKLVLISAPSVDRITLELTDGTKVIYGAAEQHEDKNYAVRKLIERYQAESKSVDTIDVRVPSRPAVRLKA